MLLFRSFRFAAIAVPPNVLPLISALTLMLGFASFLLSSFVPIQHFGELIAAAMTASLISTLAIQPAMVKLFGGPPPKRAPTPAPTKTA